MARSLLILGLGIQIISFSVFLVCVAIYHKRARKAGVPKGSWTKCLWTLYAGSALILIRSVYRTVEFASSSTYTSGYLLEHEDVYYGLESLPILLCCILFLVSSPGYYLPRDKHARLNGEVLHAGSASTTELNEKRGWMARLRPNSSRV